MSIKFISHTFLLRKIAILKCESILFLHQVFLQADKLVYYSIEKQSISYNFSCGNNFICLTSFKFATFLLIPCKQYFNHDKNVYIENNLNL